MFVEELKKIIQISNKRELRKFGFTMGIIIIIIAVILLFTLSDLGIYFIISGIILFFLTIFSPILLKPLFLIWMSLAMIIGYIMTRVILSLIYILIFTPIGIVIRLLRKDPLQEKFHPDAKTYWIPKEKNEFSPENAERQF
jgi:cytochrome b subunit of formate dehydrogenase